MSTMTYNGLTVMQHVKFWMFDINVKEHLLKFQKFQKRLAVISILFFSFCFAENSHLTEAEVTEVFLS